jgi:serine/threonine-protein kinase HipA
MGGLRLADPADGRFVSTDKVAVPPMTRLRQVQSYARRAERREALSPSEEEAEIALLVAPGSSLGGTRPKANFRADDGTLWIAKFPSNNDRWDVGGWEFALNELARNAGIRVPESRLLKLSAGHRTFAAPRFDRTVDRRRLYASAMTLTGKRDHEPASYVDIAEAITRYGDPHSIDGELEQLYRRVVFNVLVANRDDHLRNHGFLGTGAGWRLSPAFDLNPVPGKAEHALALDAHDAAPDLRAVRQSGEYYRLSLTRVEKVIEEVRAAVTPWRELAKGLGIHRDEIELMAPAIRLDGT